MQKRFQTVLLGVLVAVGFAIAPAAFARGHGGHHGHSSWSIGIGLPGLSIGYSDRGHRGYIGFGGHGWGGNYHHRPYYTSHYRPYYGYGGYYGGYYGASYYGPAYYGPAYYGPSYNTSYYRPATRVVYYDERPVRRVVRRVERVDDGYYDDGYDRRRASYYDRDAYYRR